MCLLPSWEISIAPTFLRRKVLMNLNCECFVSAFSIDDVTKNTCYDNSISLTNGLKSCDRLGNRSMKLKSARNFTSFIIVVGEKTLESGRHALDNECNRKWTLTYFIINSFVLSLLIVCCACWRHFHRIIFGFWIICRGWRLADKEITQHDPDFF